MSRLSNDECFAFQWNSILTTCMPLLVSPLIVLQTNTLLFWKFYKHSIEKLRNVYIFTLVVQFIALYHKVLASLFLVHYISVNHFLGQSHSFPFFNFSSNGSWFSAYFSSLSLSFTFQMSCVNDNQLHGSTSRSNLEHLIMIILVLIFVLIMK